MLDQNYFGPPELLKAPVKRAAYSDRTCWLMAEMSRLAYQKFEGEKSLKELATDLAEKSGSTEEILQLVGRFMDNSALNKKQARDELARELGKANFGLVNIYNRNGTQAFMAKMEKTKTGDAMLVLAFRGTEADPADVKADLKAKLIPAGNEGLVHQGFHDAFGEVKKDVEADLEDHRGIPLYITGHSLGGALAIVATRNLASDSVGACYTFGGPRVGNIKYAEHIKTPIYRVVNSADLVPRVPPALLMNFIVAGIKWIPLPGAAWVSRFLSKFRGYIHFGDMRYLTHVPDVADENGVAFKNLQLLSNPSLAFTLTWVIRRWISTFGKAAAGDHSIATYCGKLKAYALRRNNC